VLNTVIHLKKTLQQQTTHKQVQPASRPMTFCKFVLIFGFIFIESRSFRRELFTWKTSNPSCLLHYCDGCFFCKQIVSNTQKHFKVII